MKHFSLFIFLFSFALASCTKTEEAPTLPLSGDQSVTFTIAPPAETRAATTITPTRYVMEVWSEDGLTAENVFGTGDAATNHAKITSGSSFTATLDKTKAYTCLFWADDNEAFNAASLKEISLNSGKEMTEAYFAKVAVAKGKNPTVAVTLKRAVAKITLTETGTVKTDDNIELTLSGIYPTFSVLAGEATGTAAEWTKTINPQATTGTIASIYLFAKADAELSTLTFTYATEAQRTVSNIPIQQDFATSIRGEFSNMLIATFTVTADDAWATPDNDVVLPYLLKAGSFYYSDKTFSNTLDATKTCIGIVYEVNSGSISGKIVGLTEKSARWSTETANTGATSADGAANTSTVLALPSYIASNDTYPAFKWCAYLNTSATAGNSWYIPAVNELLALYGTMAVVNTSLKAAGVTELSNNYYWSSTQGDDSSARCVDFGVGLPTGLSKNGNNNVRVVSAF